MHAKGKIRKTYPPELMQTPLEKLASLPDIDKQLRCAITVLMLQQQAVQMTDLQAAEQLFNPDRSGPYLNWKRLGASWWQIRLNSLISKDF